MASISSLQTKRKCLVFAVLRFYFTFSALVRVRFLFIFIYLLFRGAPPPPFTHAPFIYVPGRRVAIFEAITLLERSERSYSTMSNKLLKMKYIRN